MLLLWRNNDKVEKVYEDFIVKGSVQYLTKELWLYQQAPFVQLMFIHGSTADTKLAKVTYPGSFSLL